MSFEVLAWFGWERAARACGLECDALVIARGEGRRDEIAAFFHALVPSSLQFRATCRPWRVRRVGAPSCRHVDV